MWVLGWMTRAALATTFVGADWGGADLIPADGDVLVGTFTNVGAFEVPLGVTVLVQAETPLEISASTVEIDGVLDGRGAGHPGGVAAFPYSFDGYPGEGLGGGEGGFGGACVHGGGGGGGGYGRAGGQGAYWYAPTPAPGGPAYGFPDTTDHPMGSGGGGSGSGCYGLPGEFGGAGGASIRLMAASALTIDGEVIAAGADGLDVVADFAGGSGGGSGGTILLEGLTVDGTGLLNASGGDGGSAVQGIFYALSGGGGGGGGGRIKIFYGVLGGGLTYDVTAGSPGLNGSLVVYSVYAQAGQNGTVYEELTDPDADGDGVDIPLDNCPGVANTDQTDTDSDGLGDACDGCPTDPSPDSDGDGVCDSQDICPDGDDGDDADGDGQPDACDPCPLDDPDDSDGDGVCDRRDTCPGFDDNGPDSDGDGVPDLCDNCPDDPNEDQDDADLDGAGEACDCNEFNPAVSPLADELCNAIDDDCDGQTDEAGADGSATWYRDADEDGEGDPASPLDACDPPEGYVDNDRDCNDQTAFAWSGGLEACDDGLDNDCDGRIDPDEQCDPKVEEDKGCGCTVPGGHPPAIVLTLLLFLVRRRRAS